MGPPGQRRLVRDRWGERYGVNDTPTNRVMPPHPLLGDAAAQVVLYERVQFGGIEEEGEEYETLLAIAEGEMTFVEAGLGGSTEIGVDEGHLEPS